jgi:hypothetical protein
MVRHDNPGTSMAETLYNGIVLPDEWPPRTENPFIRLPMRVPWLERPPEVIPIDGGRQLFVDDFLIAESGFAQRAHEPVKFPANPVFFPTTPWERHPSRPPATLPKCGGIWWDEARQRLRMWYMAGYLGPMCHAESEDGLHWVRTPNDVVPGTNLVLPELLSADSGTVFPDLRAPDSERWKMMVREPNEPLRGGSFPARLFASADGLHWREIGETGPLDDRSTCFYNPFRRRWVFSIRAWIPPRFRCRRYHEGNTFLEAARWQKGEPPFWTGADLLDESGDDWPQLYNLDAVAYETLLLGFFQIHRGPPNAVGEKVGLPKQTDLVVAYSRDGFHWHRPCRRPFIAPRREPGSWEYGYVESTGGLALIAGDELWFYYSAYAGDPSRVDTASWHSNGMYANGAVGMARLRRDGFVSLEARYPGASMTTRPVCFSAGRAFFVNANTAGADLRVEIADREGRPIPGFAFDRCIPFTGNSTRARIRWQEQEWLDSLQGRPVRFRFRLDRGNLYAFWVAPGPDGDSGGWPAAGRITTLRDTPFL